MSSREANIERLDYAITTLSDDADDLHGLITRSTDELASATEVGNRATENAEKIIEALAPLTNLLAQQHSDSAEMLEDAKKAAEDQCLAALEQVEAMQATVTEAMETLKAQSEATDKSLRETAEESFDELQTKSLKEHEKTRDELQTDILGFKNATSVRLDALETGLAKAEGTIKGLDGKMTETADALTKKIMVPVYAAIALGAANLACLVMLLMR